MRYERILSYVQGTPWAVMPETLGIMCDMLAFRANGGTLSKEDIRARLDAAEERQSVGRVLTGGVAVIPLVGVITPRADIFQEVSGFASLEKFRARFRSALKDDQVASILIAIDSPGGSVDLVPETAAEIFDARGQKPVTAIANTLAASAAFWIGASAKEFVATPSGEVGSIGVFGAHIDISQAEEMAGVKTTLIAAGKFKVEGNPFEPLTDDARAAIQARVDDFFGMFTRGVAKARGTTAAKVRDGFGEGRIVGAVDAKAEGMVDRVATLEETIARMQGRGGGRRRSRASTIHEHDLSFI